MYFWDWPFPVFRGQWIIAASKADFIQYRTNIYLFIAFYGKQRAKGTRI